MYYNPITSSLNFTDFPILESEKYILRLAKTNTELESIFRLRFQVFNQELGLGFSSSHCQQMDRDKFDDVCDHLLLICKRTGATIGTYRMQTYKMAAQGLGFDAADVFNLAQIPELILQSSVEIGRACIAQEYRNSYTLLLLWQGLANYLIYTGNQYFFGCASLLTQCHKQAVCTYNYFLCNHFLHPQILVTPNAEYSIAITHTCADIDNVEIPKIFQAYLSVGAKVCSLPAIDRSFKTIDFLIISSIGDWMGFNY